MKIEAVFTVLMLLLSFTFITVLPLPVEALPSIVRVPQDFLTIQQAIDASISGGIVFVATGTYNENITVWKPLTIKGENRDSTIIKQPGAFAVCHITADNVNISSFTMRGGSIGVWIDNSNYDSVTSTVITNNDDGVWATFSYGSVVRDNILTDNLFMGLYIEASNNTSIDGNAMASNTYGIYMQNSKDNSINGNNVSLNYADGIDVINGNHNGLFHNLISNNSLGVYLEGSNDNSIYENNLADNLEQAWAESFTTNTWDDGNHGNYWSDYTGVDNNSDGIGDTPYVINANNQDRYPLMRPWTNILVANVTPSKTVAGRGFAVRINVTVHNQGWSSATTNVTASANMTTIGTVNNLVVKDHEFSTISFTWNTAGLTYGNYTMIAHADSVSGETLLADNTLDSWVIVSIPGDVNGDSVVNIIDAIVMGNSFLSTADKPPPYWNPNADINSDNVVNILDAIVMGNHFLEHYP